VPLIFDLNFSDTKRIEGQTFKQPYMLDKRENYLDFFLTIKIC